MKGGPLARLAAGFCNQPEFRQLTNTQTPDQAADWIRATCGIESRAELDNNTDAAQRFHRQVRIPYVKWQQKQATQPQKD